jgi:hypothetical protein
LTAGVTRAQATAQAAGAVSAKQAKKARAKTQKLREAMARLGLAVDSTSGDGLMDGGATSLDGMDGALSERQPAGWVALRSMARVGFN